jgi:hypothetical protein
MKLRIDVALLFGVLSCAARCQSSPSEPAKGASPSDTENSVLPAEAGILADQPCKVGLTPDFVLRMRSQCLTVLVAFSVTIAWSQISSTTQKNTASQTSAILTPDQKSD